MNYFRRWNCKTCGESQQTVDWPENEFCDRCDLFTHLPCVVCGMRTSVTPADLYQTRRLKAVHALCVLIDNESGEKDADVQSLRRRADSATGRELAGAGGGGTQRDADDRSGSLADSRLDDDSADGNSGTRGLERREPGEARGDLPGTEIAVIDRGRKVAVTDRVVIIDGDGRGKVGDVVEIRKTLFGHVHVVMQGDDGNRYMTLEDKVAPV